MKRLLPCLALLATLSAPALAADEVTVAIEALGKVNGIALACQQPALSSRARNAVQTGAPKTRANGEAFENSTSAAFLAQGKAPCPAANELSAQLNNAEAALAKAFPPASR